MGKNFKFLFKFLERIRLHWRDYIFEVTLYNQFKFSVFGNIKRNFRSKRFGFIEANIFLKLKDFNKNRYFIKS